MAIVDMQDGVKLPADLWEFYTEMAQRQHVTPGQLILDMLTRFAHDSSGQRLSYTATLPGDPLLDHHSPRRESLDDLEPILATLMDEYSGLFHRLAQ